MDPVTQVDPNQAYLEARKNSIAKDAALAAAKKALDLAQREANEGHAKLAEADKNLHAHLTEQAGK